MKRKMTPEVEDQVLEIISRGDSAAAAAKTVGVVPQTISEHRKWSRERDGEFERRYKEAEQESLTALEDEVRRGRHRIRTRYKRVPVSEEFPDGRDVIWVEEIIEKHPQDAKWLLQKRAPHIYSTKAEEAQLKSAQEEQLREDQHVHPAHLFFDQAMYGPLLERAGYEIDWDHLMEVAQAIHEERTGFRSPSKGRQTHDGLAEYERGVSQPPEPVPAPIKAPGQSDEEEPQDNKELIKKLFDDD